MGSPKAALDWHGSTLLRRVTGLAMRSLDGPVVVVRADRQPLPELHSAVEVVSDARPGRGPVQGLAAGFAAIGDRAELAYVSSTDAPFLHPAFIRRVAGALGPDLDVALPVIDGFHQPLAAAYRVSLVGLIDELIAADDLKPASLFARCRVRRLDRQALLADSALAELDPELASLRNLNDRAGYERALALPAPAIEVSGVAQRVRAWTFGEIATALGLVPAGGQAVLNGTATEYEPSLPLVAGDIVALSA
jgi:molybdopterin-guanine dinucleotide biosynthesis protein A